PLGDTNILFFVDNDKKKQGIFLKSKEVFPPDKIKENGRAIIIICSGLHGNEIKEQIKSMDLKNKVLLVT
ncbi:MAG: hypothetical protein K9L31_03545, partial [Candidatus Pacebacteria bacterium]|nr:hypothetical protein [Candidatus Paceibacterota bacterium]